MSEKHGEAAAGSDGDLTEVRDPEDFLQRRRIKELMDARQEVRDTKTEAQMAAVGREVRDRDARSLYRTALVSYIQELRPLMHIQYPDLGADYWANRDLGTVTFSVPAEATPPSDPSGDPRPILEASEPDPIQVKGLKTVCELPTPVRRETTLMWEATMWDNDRYIEPAPDDLEGRYPGGVVKATEVLETELAWDTLDRAYTACNEFLGEIGLTVEVEEADSEWEIDV